MLILRDYQAAAIADAQSALRRSKRVLIQLSTGGGKTALACHMVKTASDRGRSSLFLCHRTELINQTSKSMQKWHVSHGLLTAGRSVDTTQDVLIGSIGTIAKRLDSISFEPKMVIWDECHHVAARSWASIHERFSRAYHIGLSATPMRTDGTGLSDYFDEMIHGPSTAWLMEHGHLSQYRAFAPAQTSEQKQLVGDVVAHWLQHAKGMRTVAFATNVEASQAIAANFVALGVPAMHLDGKTPPAIRAQAIAQFARGEILVLSNVDLFGEGFDLSAIAGCDVTIDAVILARATDSLGLYLQWVGRALRPAPGKIAVILDHCGNIARHKPPEFERTWSLTGKAIKESEPVGPLPFKCMECQGDILRPVPPRCPYCNAEISIEIRKRDIEQVAGELVELDRSLALRLAVETAASDHGLRLFRPDDFELPASLGASPNELATILKSAGFERKTAGRWQKALTAEQKAERERERKACKTFEELEQLAKVRGYSPGWADKVWGSRPRNAPVRGVH
jgi:superfamily II DNA or RNA helicase